jgi:hypothetical protein
MIYLYKEYTANKLTESLSVQLGFFFQTTFHAGGVQTCVNLNSVNGFQHKDVDRKKSDLNKNICDQQMDA